MPTTSQPRTAIVTGGGRGLGRAYCEHLASLGHRIVAADIDGATARDVAKSIAEDGGSAMSVEVDVSDPSSVDDMARAALSEYGSADILINNAALFAGLKLKAFEDIPVDEWDRLMAVNVRGPWLCARAVAPSMREAKWGRIVNVSSVVVHIGVPNYLHYVTSKSAVLGMTRSLARELGPDNITVNVLSPGGTITEIPRESISEAAVAGLIERQCLKRANSPEDLAGVVGYLVSDASSFVTGQEFVVDGGLIFD
jgi:NAD(P)-dependent dehydrogenase (short-subunit alcohol dehydrogenase family)